MESKLSTILSQLIKASDDSKLIIFVGAGVSQNSGLPSWSKLVNAMAKALNIQSSHEFTNDELLKIPEMMFQKDRNKYFNIIRKTMQKQSSGNTLDDMIVRLSPDHIITTNYDTLLERSASLNARIFQYVTIFDDSSFLLRGNSGSHFILKMHGDITQKNLEKTIVLKESDYLNYDHSHILISTFIKALLATHTFIFVGYSMSDNNLRLIINWINHLRRQLTYNNTQTHIPNNVLLYSSSRSQNYSYTQLQNYYKASNIDLIDLDTLPPEVMRYDNENSLTDKTAKSDYAILNAIAHWFPYFNNNYLEMLDQLPYTSFEDFRPVITHDIELSSNGKFTDSSLNYYGSTVIMSQNSFKRIKDIQKNTPLVDSILSKSSIAKIVVLNSNLSKYHLISVPREKSNTVFSLTKSNQFYKLFEQASSRLTSSSIESQFQYAYINYLFFPKKSIKILSNISIDGTKNYLYSLIKKLNLAFTDTEINPIGIISKIFNEQTPLQQLQSHTLREIFLGDTESFYANNVSLRKLIDEQKRFYTRDFFSANLIDALGNSIKKYGRLIETQFFVYDMYNYIHKNYLFVDFFYTSWNSIFNAYCSMIITTYVSGKNKINPKINTQRNYPLNSVDVDIIVKLTSTDFLKGQLENQHIYDLIYNNEKEFCQNFVNLCDSYKRIDKRLHLFNKKRIHPARNKFEKWVENYLLLIRYSKLSSSSLTRCLKAVFSLTEQVKVDLVILEKISKIIVDYSFKVKDQPITDLEVFLIRYLSNPTNFSRLNTPLGNLSGLSFWTERVLSCNKLDKQLIRKNIVSNSHPDYMIFFISSFKKEEFPRRNAYKVINYCLKWHPQLPIQLFENGYLLQSREYYFHHLIKQVDKHRVPKGRIQIGGLENQLIDSLLLFLTTNYRYRRKTLISILNISPLFQFVYSPKDFNYDLIDVTNERWQILLIGTLKDGKNRFTKYFRKGLTKEQIIPIQKQFIARNNNINLTRTFSFLEQILSR
ncbi:SIR2 family protein [Lentilactobacillus hilgardii]|uniref:Uncharacterized protein n=1 Tax=Lentilactobacillus hilgardii TaxID=1588 RepID=A0A6P1E2S0_LENHI|nr:SIR2 family protein [Lentilactobacillus hilgardii]EEI71667.1 hypothetical protein HMPREF0496_1086 [Lentilactobacillus hilgardii ATCC 27305]MCT3392884.1 hypothetical protein [Lentilactobacillus hilgardii]QHB51447.1 hypothetical protein GQR93_04045 [Lentilactobacillus hilgardii]RRG08896.1 MAG: hypothetical protein DUD35_10810 [Lactobacillus sp.]